MKHGVHSCIIVLESSLSVPSLFLSGKVRIFFKDMFFKWKRRTNPDSMNAPCQTGARHVSSVSGNDVCNYKKKETVSSGVFFGPFFDLVVYIRAVYDLVPVVFAHTHKIPARIAFEPDFILIRLFGLQFLFSALGAGVLYFVHIYPLKRYNE